MADPDLEPHALGTLEGLGVGREDALGDTVMVPQVDEQQLPVVALPVNPAGETHLLPDMFRTQPVILVRSISVAFCHVILTARGAPPPLAEDPRFALRACWASCLGHAG